ncbi:MAG: hypothetical protein WDN06_14230 [Asticcacaulis sp.]
MSTDSSVLADAQVAAIVRGVLQLAAACAPPGRRTVSRCRRWPFCRRCMRKARWRRRAWPRPNRLQPQSLTRADPGPGGGRA